MSDQPATTPSAPPAGRRAESGRRASPGASRADGRDQGRRHPPARDRRGRRPVAEGHRPGTGHGLVGHLPLLRQPRRAAHGPHHRCLQRAGRAGGGGQRRLRTGRHRGPVPGHRRHHPGLGRGTPPLLRPDLRLTGAGLCRPPGHDRSRHQDPDRATHPPGRPHGPTSAGRWHDDRRWGRGGAPSRRVRHRAGLGPGRDHRVHRPAGRSGTVAHRFGDLGRADRADHPGTVRPPRQRRRRSGGHVRPRHRPDDRSHPLPRGSDVCGPVGLPTGARPGARATPAAEATGVARRNEGRCRS